MHFLFFSCLFRVRLAKYRYIGRYDICAMLSVDACDSNPVPLFGPVLYISTQSHHNVDQGLKSFYVLWDELPFAQDTTCTIAWDKFRRSKLSGVIVQVLTWHGEYERGRGVAFHYLFL